jgi:pteridine reductase
MATLAGCAALVTGGAKRVGRAIVLELARGGCDVAIHHRRGGDEAEALAAEVQAVGRRAVVIPGDLHDSVTWARLVERTLAGLGRLDVLVNNASLFLTRAADTVEGFDLAVWEEMLRVNLLAPMGLCHHARAALSSGGRGCVINLCDISAARPWPEHLAYCVSKAGLVALTQGLARALAPNIRVNGVSPGIAVFPESFDADRRRRLTAQVPLAREGSPEDMARAVRFLVESADYVTGQILAVDGGRSLV